MAGTTEEDSGEGQTVTEVKGGINSDLWNALKKARKNNVTQRSRQDLIDHLTTTKAITESEFNGLIKHFVAREHPGASKVSQKLTLAFMRCVKRLRLHL
eukprot:5150679-Lingulodinium_polyedra.AAC.1